MQLNHITGNTTAIKIHSHSAIKEMLILSHYSLTLSTTLALYSAHHYNFNLKIMLYKWNNTVYNLLILTIFT